MSRKLNQLKDLNLITEQTRPDMSIHGVMRPAGGWLHTVRQALGLSLKAVADTMKLSPQAIHQVEKSEANGTISLKQLEAVAGAMNCRLVYLLVPRAGILAERAETQIVPESLRTQGTVVSVEGAAGEFPMALR